jgi:alanine racemase
MTRPSKALIDLAALRQNYLTAQTLHGGRALAVIKANAYGHGLASCLNVLRQCDALGVAHIDMPITPEAVWLAVRSKPAA